MWSARLCQHLLVLSHIGWWEKHLLTYLHGCKQLARDCYSTVQWPRFELAKIESLVCNRTWQTIVGSSPMPAHADSAYQIHRCVLSDVHGMLTAIGVLTLLDYGSVWNSLPAELRQCDSHSFKKFKLYLKTHFFAYKAMALCDSC